jgi:Flp pilus assembly protein TadG
VTPGRQRAQGLIELALVMPCLLLAVMILLCLGIVLRADGGVAGVAAEAARVAALASDPRSAEIAAQNQAATLEQGYGLTNGSLKLSVVDTSRFQRGGEVRIVVTYVVPVGKLPLLGWQAIKLHHEAFAPVDPNRTFR